MCMRVVKVAGFEQSVCERERGEKEGGRGEDWWTAPQAKFCREHKRERRSRGSFLGFWGALNPTKQEVEFLAQGESSTWKKGSYGVKVKSRDPDSGCTHRCGAVSRLIRW